MSGPQAYRCIVTRCPNREADDTHHFCAGHLAKWEEAKRPDGMRYMGWVLQVGPVPVVPWPVPAKLHLINGQAKCLVCHRPCFICGLCKRDYRMWLIDGKPEPGSERMQRWIAMRREWDKRKSTGSRLHRLIRADFGFGAN